MIKTYNYVHCPDCGDSLNLLKEEQMYTKQHNYGVECTECDYAFAVASQTDDKGEAFKGFYNKRKDDYELAYSIPCAKCGLQPASFVGYCTDCLEGDNYDR